MGSSRLCGDGGKEVGEVNATPNAPRDIWHSWIPQPIDEFAKHKQMIKNLEKSLRKGKWKGERRRIREKIQTLQAYMVAQKLSED